MVPKGFSRIAVNENINGTAVVTTYFNSERKLLYVGLERDGKPELYFGPFEPSYLDLLCTNLKDVLDMKGRYHSI